MPEWEPTAGVPDSGGGGMSMYDARSDAPVGDADRDEEAEPTTEAERAFDAAAEPLTGGE